MNNRVLVTCLGLGLLSFACAHKESKPEASPVAATPATTQAEPFSPTKAQAVIKAAPGSTVKGIVHFTETDGVMTVEVMVDGLKAGPHGFHVHETGDCSAKDFSTAGGHFNPSKHQHGAPTVKEHHEGDLGNITANKKGSANTKIQVSGMTMSAGAESIIGKALVIHQDADDLKSQPAGNSGKRIGCGVIEAL